MTKSSMQSEERVVSEGIRTDYSDNSRYCIERWGDFRNRVRLRLRLRDRVRGRVLPK